MLVDKILIELSNTDKIVLKEVQLFLEDNEISVTDDFDNFLEEVKSIFSTFLIEDFKNNNIEITETYINNISFFMFKIRKYLF